MGGLDAPNSMKVHMHVLVVVPVLSGEGTTWQCCMQCCSTQDTLLAPRATDLEQVFTPDQSILPLELQALKSPPPDLGRGVGCSVTPTQPGTVSARGMTQGRCCCCWMQAWYLLSVDAI